MSRYKGNDEECPHCELKYRDFRTGETYYTIWLMFYDNSPDRSEWKRKSRGVILGKWFEIKQELWNQHIWGGECEEDPRNLKEMKHVH